MSLDAKSYWSDPAHANWQCHYVHGAYGGQILCFTTGWKNKNLPKNETYSDSPEAFRVVLRDATDGKLYETRLFVSYEHADTRQHYQVVDTDWNPVAIELLQAYFYGSHHCPCHRKADADRAGAVTDDACEGNRFQIERITAVDMPELILYSETWSAEDLEEKLQALPRLCCEV